MEGAVAARARACADRKGAESGTPACSVEGLATLLGAGALLRAVLIGAAVLQDLYVEVPYTDIDYDVFSQAAENVALGLSPFNERTPLLQNPETRYRYSPLLAYALLPNVFFHRAWGKMFFSTLDVVAACYLGRWLQAHNQSRRCVLGGVAFWLFNPFTFTISTRGSCESVTVLLLYGVLHALHAKKLALGAILFGLAVHFRLYPIIYLLPVLLSLSDPDPRRGIRGFFSKEAIVFSVISGSTFLALLAIFSWAYGGEFITTTYLHHASRVDTKHNFSVYFYPLRFLPELAKLSLPVQLGACLLFGWRAQSLAHAMLLQTLAFVALNRVITAQYFVWWLALLPPALPWILLDARLITALACWAAAEVHWLLWAYLLEFRGWPVALNVWAASCLFLACSLNVLVALCRPGPLARVGQREC